MKPSRHKLLKRQLAQARLSDELLASDVMRVLLEKINQTYHDADKERYWLEQSLTITSQEMAELYDKLAMDSHARIKAISSALPDMMFFVNQQHRILEAFGDHVFADLVNRTFEGEQGVSEYFIQPFSDQLQQRLDHIFGNSGTTVFNFELPSAEAVKHHEVRLIKTDIVINGVQTAMGLIRDVTAEIVKQHRASLVSRIMKFSKEAVVIYDQNGLITFCNASFRDLFNRTKYGVTGEQFDFLQCSLDKELSARVWRKVNASGIWKGEWQMADGKRQRNLNMQFEQVALDLGQIYYIAVINDITELQYSRDELLHVAYHDFLTGLPNRKFYYEELKAKLTSTADDRIGAVLYFDLDRFKTVNDSLGHRVGDDLLVAVTNRLSQLLQSNEFLTRMGGDEFTILKFDCQHRHEINDCAQRVLQAFAHHFQVGRHEIEIKTSIGISTYPDDSTDVDDLTQFADTAMYHSKNKGGNDFKYFSQSLKHSALQDFRMEQELRKAIHHNQLTLDYQPLVARRHGNITSVEALSRWCFEGEFISPDVFIPIAEVTGLINDLGLWVLDAACQQLKRWLNQGVNLQRIAVNVSRVQLADPKFAQQVISCLHKHDLAGQFIEFEVTENALVANNQVADKNIKQLHAANIWLTIDDFGTGHSSLSNLRQYPFSTIKIDRSFVAGIERNADDEVIIRTTLAMAKELGLDVVAEGVETPQQALFLNQIGCQFQQGYYHAKPMPADHLELPLKNCAKLV